MADTKASQDQQVEAATAPTAAAGAAPPKPKSDFTIDILNMTKAAQIQHGLRHGDYTRYRQYCARRLTRLRSSLGFTHGKGRFAQKRLAVHQVTQQRFLLLPLLSAERSWSLAMELKEQTDNPRARFHMLRRLKKAVKACNELVALCAETADDKTKLEAEAYASWMTGNLCLEQEDWAPALDSFTRARTIYDNLSKVGDADTQETFKLRVQEIEPTIRFCNYNLSQGGEDISGLRGTQGGPASDVLLQAKLDKVLTDLRKKQGEAMREVTWNGKTVPVKNDKLRELVLSAQDNIFEIEKLEVLEAKLELYDKTFIVYNDALNLLRDELRQFQGAKKNIKSESQESDLRFLFDFVSFTKLSHTVDRNLLLVNSLTCRLEGKGDPKQRVPSPKEVIKLYDTIIQNVNEMSELRDAEDENYHKNIAARLLTFKSFRCFYVAHSYYNASKWPETLALLQRTTEYTKSALDHHEKCSPPSTEDIKSLRVLQGRVKGKRAASQAKAFAESQPAEEKQETGEAAGAEGGKLDLNKFDLDPRRLKGESLLIDFPPDFEAIPCKPVLFDLALSAVTFPDLSERRKTKAKGFFSFWRS